MSNKGISEQERLRKVAARSRKRWLNRFAAEFCRLQFISPDRDYLPKDCPQWIERVQEEYLRATHREVELVRAKIITPRLLGALLGYQCANAVWMTEVLAKMLEEAERNPGKEFTAEEVERATQFWRKFDDWYDGMRRLAGRVLKSAVYQSYEDMSAFLTAFSNGFNRKPKVTAGIGDFGSTNFAIYHFMLMHWRAVDRLDSVPSLHQLLRRCLGEYRTGDLKRVEKICQRVGLHYRKPGRPKKAGAVIQTRS